ncbi:MAG: glycogen debranching enzyme N-terminal domain-containing protein [Candidatus Micrarchaeota archaeon]|nr:glycogen debranching enzyme N-terminal domain-containing protein [Candidatus Micrarchaeota archaeon]
MALLKGPFPEKEALLREWVLANPSGGYASSSIAFANTRKQHGLLVSESDGARSQLVPKLEEAVIADGGRFSLSTSQYGGALHPDGFTRLMAFSSRPLPTFQYAAEGITVEKTIFPAGGKNAIGARYAVFSGKAFEMEIRPMLNFRPVNGITHGRPGYGIMAGKSSVSAKCGGCEAALLSDKCGFFPDEKWYFDFFYARDAERGTECSEHYFSPGAFRIKSEGSAEFFIVACEGAARKIDAHAAFEAALARANAISGAAGKNGRKQDEFLSSLLLAADSFIARHDGKAAIIAGYPWFSEWGRDSMISLPGLLLCTGRQAEAREVLAKFASLLKDGQLPNVIGEDGAPTYNSADASLWFAHAAAKYADASQDEAFASKIFLPAMQGIVEGYAQGTENGICLDSDGLLIAGKAGSNLTWMDVRFEDGACPTPRWGKPVEVNALWYSSLRISERAFKRADGKFADRCAGLARKCGASFRKFWNKEQQCLFDVIGPDSAKVRPNQIFAASLPYSPLGKAERAAVFRKVTDELLTPVGLRTLTPKDPDYRGTYRGGMRERDFAYHNGCVWPWLMGAYIDASVGLGATPQDCLALLSPFKKQLYAYGVGSLPEIYEADTLRPDGCISQAWSVAEVLRKYVEL